MYIFRTLVVYGVAVAVILILIKVVWGTPLVKGLRTSVEGFASTRPTNTSTECPTGSVMYMYEGVPYCCGGQVNSDAEIITRTCLASTSNPTAPTPLFCTLGPTTSEGIPNCIETKAGLYEAKGEAICPPSMPNFVMTDVSHQTCCTSATTADLTACMDPTQGSCNVSNSAYWLGTATSCQYQRLHENNSSCTPGQKSTTIQDNITKANASGGSTTYMVPVWGCTDASGGNFCVSKALSKRLNEMFGPGTSTYPICAPKMT